MKNTWLISNQAVAKKKELDQYRTILTTCTCLVNKYNHVVHVVQCYPWFNFDFSLFDIHYHILA